MDCGQKVDVVLATTQMNVKRRPVQHGPPRAVTQWPFVAGTPLKVSGDYFASSYRI